MSRYLFDVDPSFYDDYSRGEFYQDEESDHDAVVALWKKVAKELTPAQISLTLGENIAEAGPISEALRPALDRLLDRARVAEAKAERGRAWASSTDGQLRSMVKRRSKDKKALDYISNPQQFLQEVSEFKRGHPQSKQWSWRMRDGVKSRPLYPRIDDRVVAKSATSFKE